MFISTTDTYKVSNKKDGSPATLKLGEVYDCFMTGFFYPYKMDLSMFRTDCDAKTGFDSQQDYVVDFRKKKYTIGLNTGRTEKILICFPDMEISLENTCDPDMFGQFGWNGQPLKYYEVIVDAEHIPDTEDGTRLTVSVCRMTSEHESETIFKRTVDGMVVKINMVAGSKEESEILPY